VVGVALTSSEDPSCLVGGEPQPPFYELQAALPAIWENDRVKALPLFPGDSHGEAAGINDLGQVVGWSGGCVSNTEAHALLWEKGRVVNLGSLGGAMNNFAQSINNRGEVTGGSDLAGDATGNAFLWRNGVMTGLGTLPGDSSSYGSAINDQGQIVGISCDIKFNCSPFLWENGTMTDLNTLIPADSNLQLLLASAIDDRGEIVGYAYDQSTGDLPAFLAVVRPSGSDNEAPAAQLNSIPKVTLPENVRTAVQQQLRRGRFGAPLLQPR
jgi:probable HAF family extracellular repeat protein